MKKNKFSFFLLFIIGLIFFVFTYFTDETYSKDTTEFNENSNILSIYFIDVGQGDATFIELPNNETMLIDAGEAKYGEVVYNYINNLGIKKIDYLIGTHPHTDHIGGLSYIISNLDIGKIYMPKATSTSKTYENLLKTIKNKNLSVKTAKSGVYILNIDDLKIEIISPTQDSYSGLNNYSVVLKITYKDNKFLFMGDAEELVEKEIKDDVSADVIKVGHHGSVTSSSNDFINKVSPKYAIILVGENNKYNHPSSKVLNSYESIGAKIYRTDLNGNIKLESDGSVIRVSVDK